MNRMLALGSACELVHGRAELSDELPGARRRRHPRGRRVRGPRALRPDARALLILTPGGRRMSAPTTAPGAPDPPCAVPPSEIGRTPTGPRELPPLRPPAAGPGAARDRRRGHRADSGLRVIAVRGPRCRWSSSASGIPFWRTRRTHPALAEVLATTSLRGPPAESVRDRQELGWCRRRPVRRGGSRASVRVRIGAGQGLDVVLDILADALTSASYGTAEVARERNRLVERLTLNRSQPQVIAREALQRRRYGNHPFAREWPEVDNVAAVTPAAVRALHRRSVVPGGAVLVLVGDIDPGARSRLSRRC